MSDTGLPLVAGYARQFLTGTMVFVHNRVRGLGGSYHVRVYCQERLNEHLFPHADVTVLPRWTGWSERLRRSVHRRLRGRYPPLSRGASAVLRADLISRRIPLLHAYFGPDGAEVLPAVRGLPIRLVVSFAGFDSSTMLRDSAYRRSLDDLLARADAVVSVCEHQRDRLLELGLDPRKAHVIHNGVRLEDFEFHPPAPDGGESVTFFHLSGLVEKKGVPTLIRAFAKVRSSGLDARLVVGGDGPARPAARALAEELGLNDRVAFPGYVDPRNRHAFYREGEVFVHASETDPAGNQEGIPNALKEAMATGVPVIGSRHGGIPELVDDGVEGLLVPEGDVDALAEAMIRLGRDPGSRAAMGKRGRERIEREFCHGAEIRDLAALYESLLASLRGRRT